MSWTKELNAKVKKGRQHVMNRGAGTFLPAKAIIPVDASKAKRFVGGEFDNMYFNGCLTSVLKICYAAGI